MIRICTASRLHFGLLNVGNLSGARGFGGIGMMIDRPGVHLVATPSTSWEAHGPLADRALKFAHDAAESLPKHCVRPLHLCIEQCAPEHVGLGTGTQLALAVAHAVVTAGGGAIPVPVDLARAIGRGLRSAIGIHGFVHGGFLVDAGKSEGDQIAPLAMRLDFPDAWGVVLVIPPAQHGLHGTLETNAFVHLQSQLGTSLCERLSQVVFDEIVPALRQRQFQKFGEALFAYNALVGDTFAPVQGGRYASSIVAELVDFARSEGISGVGQSSWGPAVFAVTSNPADAECFVSNLARRFRLPPGALQICKGCNHGAAIESIGAD